MDEFNPQTIKDSDSDQSPIEERELITPSWQLSLQLEGYEGPIDLLLSLAREHKVDLTKIQILPLAEQYLAFINRAHRLNLEIAADYLVMAAWLGYLKSLLLLPKEAQAQEDIPPQVLAELLAFRLRQLEAMQQAARDLQTLPRQGYDFFPRSSHEKTSIDQQPVYEFGLYELLTCYGQIYKRQKGRSPLKIVETKLHSMEAALERLKILVADVPEWCDLQQFMPDFEEEADPLVRRSVISANFAACLELARGHHLDLKQAYPFAPIFIRKSNQQEQEETTNA